MVKQVLQRGNTSAGGFDAKATERPLAVDTSAVADLLLGRWKEERLAARKFAANPALHDVPGLPMELHRQRVFDQLSIVSESGFMLKPFPRSVGGADNHGGAVAGGEELVTADPSLQIKSGVHWGLFGSAIMHLGNQKQQQRWLPQVFSVETPGVFAMTETGHGSDVSSIATTAIFDEQTQEFVIHTPFRGAWKDYLGNAALHGKAAVVFAQLITQGVNHGVHALYVPIRDDKGELLPGIGAEDDGYKGGLNGIDNGRLHFDSVRIPRENLLDRYGSVNSTGGYSSPIKSPGRRFFTMLGTLVQGRVSLDGSALVAMKVGLTVALRYASERRQFKDALGAEKSLLDYQRHQYRLIPRLAELFAMSSSHEELLEVFDAVFSGADDSEQNRERLETLAAALKPLSTWAAIQTLQECREATGGAGFLAENRIVNLRHDLDIYTTFEGDNNVLLQLVAKRLLTDYGKQFKGADSRQLARYAVSKTTGDLYRKSGLSQTAQNISDLGGRIGNASLVLDDEFQRGLLKARIDKVIEDVAPLIGKAAKKSKQEAEEVFNRNQNRLIEAAQAYGEFLQWQAFTRTLGDMEESDTKKLLTWLRDLFGLGLVQRHAAELIVSGHLSARRLAAVTEQVGQLIADIRPYVLDLVDAFGYDDEHIRAKIATGVEAERQEEARQYYAMQRASGQEPATEKSASHHT